LRYEPVEMVVKVESRSNPGTYHKVSLISNSWVCDCVCYKWRRTCNHERLLLKEDELMNRLIKLFAREPIRQKPVRDPDGLKLILDKIDRELRGGWNPRTGMVMM